MSTRRVLEELRHKKRCIERAIRALERLQELEDGQRERREGTSNLVVLEAPPKTPED